MKFNYLIVVIATIFFRQFYCSLYLYIIIFFFWLKDTLIIVASHQLPTSAILIVYYTKTLNAFPVLAQPEANFLRKNVRYAVSLLTKCVNS